jgi:hypothetical protein
MEKEKKRKRCLTTMMIFQKDAADFISFPNTIFYRMHISEATMWLLCANVKLI